MAADASTSASISANERRMTAPHDSLSPDPDARDHTPPAVAVVVPVRNEAGNVGPLVQEIATACAAFPSFEVVYVDDGSSDETPRILAEQMRAHGWLRVLRHEASC